MSVTGALATAISGLLGQAQSVAVAANNIANSSTPGYRPAEVSFTTVGAGGRGGVRAVVRAPAPFEADAGAGSEVDVAQEFGRLIQAQAAYDASAKMFGVASRMTGSLLDIQS